MNAVLWLLQLVLALAFVPLGALLVRRSRERLQPVAAWVEDYPEGFVTAVGVLEVLGGLGVVVPAVLGVATVLVPWAALGLAVLMLAGLVALLVRGDRGRQLQVTGALLVVSAIVAAGRFGPWPL